MPACTQKTMPSMFALPPMSCVVTIAYFNLATRLFYSYVISPIRGKAAIRRLSHIS